VTLDPLRRYSDLIGRSGSSLDPARAQPADAKVTIGARELGGAKFSVVRALRQVA
jgi:hypothetical protein